MLGVWIEPVTAQVMMTFPCAAAMGVGSGEKRVADHSMQETALDQIPCAAAYGDRLAADVPAGVGGEEERGIGDVLRGHRGLERDTFDHALENFLRRHAELLGFRANDPLDALAFDDAG